MGVGGEVIRVTTGWSSSAIVIITLLREYPTSFIFYKNLALPIFPREIRQLEFLFSQNRFILVRALAPSTNTNPKKDNSQFHRKSSRLSFH